MALLLRGSPWVRFVWRAGAADQCDGAVVPAVGRAHSRVDLDSPHLVLHLDFYVGPLFFSLFRLLLFMPSCGHAQAANQLDCY
ncbi:hypothetical protein QBC34DRAFT_391276 [Podospora aff. communis PSN243]|uniref:Uncharacterized protein n=1 Tax=Podospora aff. communis PSN243 TaxID=3040156 RepID=A0AAV9H7F0_9PEZI|nr:hypothetical protein QBC34DRAFT_391276 [Podospora aff. communis PSN243]